MQLYPILLIAVLLARDGGLQFTDNMAITGWGALAIAFGPIIALLVISQVAVSWYQRRLTRGDTPRAIIAAERFIKIARWFVLAQHITIVLVFDWLGAIRDATGNLILLDELIAITPALTGILGLWWVYYPIERRIRDALLMRRLDHGQPIYPSPSRIKYVIMQARIQLLLLLVPLLLILTLSETIDFALAPWSGHEWFRPISDLTSLAAGISVFMFAPLVARFVLGLVQLPKGQIRNDLEGVCKAQNVKVRGILLWKTDGAMINAAVMGLIGRLRYVMLTDALLETLSRRQIQAVMAHEIGHIRLHHMPWLVGSLMAVISAMSFISVFIIEILTQSSEENYVTYQSWYDGAAAIITLMALFFVFGWVSRRFERQADTFAVQHLSKWPNIDADHQDDEAEVNSYDLSLESIQTMQGALHTIARLHAVPRSKRSWRHGSIEWRSQYLARIIGLDGRKLAIHRQIRWIKFIAGFILSLTLAYIIIGLILG